MRPSSAASGSSRTANGTLQRCRYGIARRPAETEAGRILRDSHVTIRGPVLKFKFRGKSGLRHSVRVTNRRLARIVKGCRDLPGQELFQYVDDAGRRCNIGSGDVNDYLREICGEDFTAKDFRTWAGTVLLCAAFRHIDAVDTPASKRVLQAVDAVAGILGNTRAVCRKSYIHPAVIDALAEGAIGDISRPARVRRGLTPDECSLLAVLDRLAKQPKKKAA